LQKEDVMSTLGLRRIVLWTFLGLATVVLIGPVMAVVGTVLPFTLIGVLVWLTARGVHRLVARFRGSAASDKLAQVRANLPEVARSARQAVEHGIRKCREFGPAVCEGAREVVQRGARQAREVVPVIRGGAQRLREHGRVLWRVATEVVCGSLAGALLCWYAAGPGEVVAVGAAAGAALGLLTSGLGRSKPRELAAE
jgi:hypothetical protein